MEKRKVFKFVDDKEVEIPFKDIKKGMKIKLYDSEPGDDSEISFTVSAESDAYKNEDGIYTIESLTLETIK